MNRTGLALRSMRHYWRAHAGVLVGSAIGAAVLVGALVVGDSVRGSLRRQALLRIGLADVALDAGDRFVRDGLADDIAGALDGGAGGVAVAPVLRLEGLASTPDGSRRANEVRVHGVDARFLALAVEPAAASTPEPGTVLLSERLARQLDAVTGERVVLRLERPSAMPRDMVLAANEDLTAALRVEVGGVLADAALGRFGLEASQVAPYNAFVDLAWLQSRLDLDGRVNMLLGGGADVDSADAALRRVWRLADAELASIEHGTGAVDLVSSRVFIDDPIAQAAADAAPGAAGVLTYFVNGLRRGDRETPYSMVSAIGPLGAAGTGWWFTQIVPADLGDEQIVINRWLADDLEAEIGDAIEVDYFVLGESRRLEERTASFRVRSIVELAGSAADPTLMPDFPGLADSDHCRDWEPGIPIELDRIRDADEAYWDDHRGTPKAFITLEAGRRLWGNRFGGLTAIRMPAGSAKDMLAALRDAVPPASVGLYFRDVRGPALAASTSATDFGGLFLGLSLFLIVSALLLIALLFVFGVEQRAVEIGTLLAMGFRPAEVRRLLLREAAAVALLGCLGGAVLGLAYTRLVLLGLETVWRDAVGATSIGFHVRPASLALGAAMACAGAIGTMWLALRRQVARPPTELLSERAGVRATPPVSRGRPGLVALGCVVAAIVIVMATGAGRGAAAAGAFFGAGSLLVVAAVAASRALLGRLDRAGARLSVGALGVRNGVRRAGRSLAVIALVASGTFMVIAVGANRLDAAAGATSRSSGTGGFALVARSSIGVPQDLDAPEGRDAFGLDASLFDGVSVVPMRLRAGDDASCLNLSLSQQPRLLGVDPAALAEREAFTFTATIDDAGAASPWRLLGREIEPDGDLPIVPAIGDQASLTWAMHKAVGDDLDYRDERGRPFRVRIVGAVANSILQGNLVIDERRFKELFPSESGARVFLVDAPPERAAEVAEQLGRMMSDVGLEVTAATARLAEFNAVQNTYLAIFQVLGGLGVLLGSAGLGVVVLRNLLERRGELALLRAVGFRARTIRWLVFSEHGLLLALGLAGGTGAAIVAVIPALRSPGAEPPVASTAVLVAALAVSGLLWVWAATIWGLRGPILEALRNE